MNYRCEIMDNNANPCVILCQMYSIGLFDMDKNSKIIEIYFLTLKAIVLHNYESNHQNYEIIIISLSITIK
jgi:hypothetical protein